MLALHPHHATRGVPPGSVARGWVTRIPLYGWSTYTFAVLAQAARVPPNFACVQEGIERGPPGPRACASGQGPSTPPAYFKYGFVNLISRGASAHSLLRTLSTLRARRAGAYTLHLFVCLFVHTTATVHVYKLHDSCRLGGTSN